MTDKLREAAQQSLTTIEAAISTLTVANEQGKITDTIWINRFETLFDFLGSEADALRAALAEQPAVAGPVEPPVRPLGADVLHCYAQPDWHAEAYISGGRDALMALRATIDRALLHAGLAECEAFTSDGEGYTVYVVAMSDEDAERQVVPYTHEIAAQNWNGRPGPWDALKAAHAEFSGERSESAGT